MQLAFVNGLVDSNLNPISSKDFETEMLKNKEAVRWFIGDARQKLRGIAFNSFRNIQ